jgi:hypothetical protein
VEEILLELLGFIKEIVAEILIEAALELVMEWAASLLKYVRARSPVFSAVALLIGGAGAGFISCLLFPYRILSHQF